MDAYRKRKHDEASRARSLTRSIQEIFAPSGEVEKHPHEMSRPRYKLIEIARVKDASSRVVTREPTLRNTPVTMDSPARISVQVRMIAKIFTVQSGRMSYAVTALAKPSTSVRWIRPVYMNILPRRMRERMKATCMIFMVSPQSMVI